MIVIAFVPGTFGTTIEYILRRFTSYSLDFTETLMPQEDGSMHNFIKIGHIYESAKLTESILKYKNTDNILTPIYPFEDLSAKETIDILNNISIDNKTIVIYIENLEMAEINMLFQYYKISLGLGFGIESIFNSKLTSRDTCHWNNIADLEDWEKREWFSIYYVGWVQEWIDSKHYVNSHSLLISSSNMLFNTINAINQIISYCGLLKVEEDKLNEFIAIWRDKQQYVLDEYTSINQFVENTIKNVYYIHEHKNIISEAIVQQKLRSKGYEIRCWKLNKFPSQAQELHKLLEKI